MQRPWLVPLEGARFCHTLPFRSCVPRVVMLPAQHSRLPIPHPCPHSPTRQAACAKRKCRRCSACPDLQRCAPRRYGKFGALDRDALVGLPACLQRTAAGGLPATGLLVRRASPAGMMRGSLGVCTSSACPYPTQRPLLADRQPGGDGLAGRPDCVLVSGHVLPGQRAVRCQGKLKRNFLVDSPTNSNRGLGELGRFARETVKRRDGRQCPLLSRRRRSAPPVAGRLWAALKVPVGCQSAPACTQKGP